MTIKEHQEYSRLMQSNLIVYGFTTESANIILQLIYVTYGKSNCDKMEKLNCMLYYEFIMIIFKLYAHKLTRIQIVNIISKNLYRGDYKNIVKNMKQLNRTFNKYRCSYVDKLTPHKIFEIIDMLKIGNVSEKTKLQFKIIETYIL